MVPPRGVTCMTNPQYFFPPNIFSELTYPLSPPPRGYPILKVLELLIVYTIFVEKPLQGVEIGRSEKMLGTQKY